MERSKSNLFESGFRAVSNCVVLMVVLLCGLGEITHAQAPAPPGWFSGDMHVHRSCGDAPVSVSTITNDMVAQNLSVVSLLADMGNGEVLDPASDLPKVNGQNAPESPPGRILRWDAEWHWDPIYFHFPHQALGGHIVALGLTNAYQLWSESTSTIFDWARNQGAISGFAHMQYLGDEFPQTLNCCIPIEYPVEMALGTCDFVSQDVAGSDSAMRAYYRLLNCGFRPGLAAGSDYPCNAQIGAVLTYVQVPGELTYRKWIDGIAAGRTVVSRNGNNEFLDLKVNGDKSPGDEIQLAGAGTVSVTVQWLANQNLSGTIELLQNGVVVASRAASVTANTPHTWTTNVTFARSGWLAARRVGVGGHQSHTAAVFVLVNGAPVRASAADALFYVNWMDELLARTAEGAEWGNYYSTNRALAHSRYQAARAVFQQIAVDAGYQPRPPVAIGNGDDGFSSDEIYGGGSYINAARFQAASNMTVSAVQAKVSAVSGNYKCAIYADNSGQPGGFLRGTIEATVASDRWQSFPLTAPQALTSGAFYWLAIWSDDPNARVFYSDNNGTLQWGQHNYGTWPDPLTTSGGGSHQYCIYASTTSVTLTNLSITPNSPTVLISSNQSFVATGAYSDGSTLNLTLQVTWASSNAAVASINAAGVATGVAVGTATISATLAGVTASTLLTVTDDLPVAGDYRSAATGNWSSTSTWQRFNGSSWVSATAIPTSTTAGTVRIRSGHNVTVAGNVTVDQVVVLAGGQLTVGAATLTVANGAGTDLDVFGILATTTSTSASISLNSGATVAFNSGATYQHARDGGSIPIATWHSNSVCLITGVLGSTAPSNLGQGFGHFTWNCASQSSALSLAGGLNTVNGNFTVTSTGTGSLSLGGTSVGNLMIGGNFTQTGGTLIGSSSAARTVTVSGDFMLSGGTFNLSASTTAGNAVTVTVGGNFTHTAGTLTESGSTTGSGIIFPSGWHTYTSGGSVANTVNFTVNNGATLMMGTSLVGNGSSGTFTLSSGGTLGVGHVQGITTSGTSGNVRVAGTRTYSTSGNYIYNGTAPQVTGNGLPTGLTSSGSLTIDNPAGVALSASFTGTGPVTVTTNGLLAGSNGFAGPLTLNGAVSPGASVGSLNTGAQTWNGGGTYVWELNNATGSAGSGYDRLNAGANAITIGASSAEKFTLKLVTLNGASPGLAANFNPNSVYTWTIASGGSLNGFAAEKFAIDASAFQNDIGSGVFRVQQSGGNLQLTFSRDVQITTTSLPIGEVNAAYSAGLTATGGPAPFTWSLLSGTLPPGLTLHNSGSITGTPTSAGIFNFTVQASDAGSPSATASRSFSIAVVLPSPILVLTNAANPFTAYYSEILLTEGLNSFALADASTLSAGMLAQREVVILGEQSLTEAQVITLSNWVHQGGNLVALRPDKKLAGLLGLVDAAATLSEGYLLVNTASGPGAGIVGETMQFHGTADRYTLDGASNLATLYANASTPTANPAVTLRDVGSNGGQAAAFTYDLARSVVYTRQGNPAWEGQERDGIAPLRSSDLFFGNAGGDPQPDWVDFDKIAIPQADEQQRLLANLILQMNADRRLMPRFWYFPDGHKAAIVMTGDDHASNGTTAHFDQFLATSGTNTLVDEWKTIRSTSYIYPNTPLSDAAAAGDHAPGFENGLHCSTGCGDYTANDWDGYIQTP
ncbi:MAG: CehA/McbA family metallohydrolase, partial [Verrucomicrobia bacterium]|nr:CehA/McbA family metallohydrolase [Verrucomicrobiota bacterium]